MEKKTVKINIYTHQSIKILAAKKGINLEDYIDNILNEYLSRKRK